MKFFYSSIHYLLGFIAFLCLTFYGLYEIRQTFIVKPWLFIGYVLFCYSMLSTYLKSYLTYKDKYVYVYKEGLIFGDRNKVTGVQHGDIDMIIEARHKHRIKLYRIIHVFLKDGRYFYFTTDIAKYKAFKVMLREHYESCYYVREHLFPEGVEATKENLMDETI